jgi:hypothetical protein
MIKEEHPEAVEQYLIPVLPHWLSSFKENLENFQFQNNELLVTSEVLKTLVKLIRAFPKETSSFLFSFLEKNWFLLSKLSAVYQSHFVLSDESLQGTVDSEGETMGLESILFSLFDYISIAAKKKGFKSLLNTRKENAGAFLNQLVQVVLVYMQMTVDMVIQLFFYKSFFSFLKNYFYSFFLKKYRKQIGTKMSISLFKMMKRKL